MKINLNLILKSAILLTVGCAAACQSNQASESKDVKPATNQTTATSTPTENKDTVPANSNKPESNKTVSSDTKVLLDTPTNAYKTAHAARQKKDIETLKKVMSKDALEFFSIMSEPGESIDKAILKMTETPQAATDESRNEKINGDTATLEYPDAKGKWRTMDFVKEDGGWKLTFPKGVSESQEKPKK